MNWRKWLGQSGRIPRKVAKCPECGRTLKYEVTSCDSAGWIELALDCGRAHRYRQSDWQDTKTRCEAWVREDLTAEAHGRRSRTVQPLVGSLDGDK